MQTNYPTVTEDFLIPGSSVDSTYSSLAHHLHLFRTPWRLVVLHVFDRVCHENQEVITRKAAVTAYSFIFISNK